MKQLTFKLYGVQGQIKTGAFDFSSSDDTRIIEIEKDDCVYTIKITRDGLRECWHEIAGQLSDGFFEGHRFERITITDGIGEINAIDLIYD